MVLAFAIGAAAVLIGFLAIVLHRTNDPEIWCTTDIPCQECGMCYGDHLDAKTSYGHTYVYPHDLNRIA